MADNNPAPITVDAKEGMFSPRYLYAYDVQAELRHYLEAERFVPKMSEENFEKKMDVYRSNIKGTDEEKEAMDKVLTFLGSTKQGRLVLENAEDNLSFSWDESKTNSGTYYGHEKRLSLSKNSYDPKMINQDGEIGLSHVKDAAVTLQHEVMHSWQNKEDILFVSTSNLKERFSSYKMAELATKVNDVVYADEINAPRTQIDLCVEKYRTHKEDARKKYAFKNLPPHVLESNISIDAREALAKEIWANIPAPRDRQNFGNWSVAFWNNDYNKQTFDNITALGPIIEDKHPNVGKESINRLSLMAGVSISPEYWVDNLKDGQGVSVLQKKFDEELKRQALCDVFENNANNLQTADGRVCAKMMIDHMNRKDFSSSEIEKNSALILGEIKKHDERWAKDPGKIKEFTPEQKELEDGIVSEKEPLLNKEIGELITLITDPVPKVPDLRNKAVKEGFDGLVASYNKDTFTRTEISINKDGKEEESSITTFTDPRLKTSFKGEEKEPQKVIPVKEEHQSSSASVIGGSLTEKLMRKKMEAVSKPNIPEKEALFVMPDNVMLGLYRKTK